MNDYIDFKTFSNGPEFYGDLDQEEFLKSTTKRLNNDLSGWTMIKVPIKHEFIDDLTEVITYEIRYRLYLSTVYELLGFDKGWAESLYSSFYWEKDKDGNMTDLYLQHNI